MIKVERRHKATNEDTLTRLRRLADTMSLMEMRQIVDRDATLKLILLLPEAVLDQALSVGKALQACAEHRRKIPGGREEGCRKS